MAKQMRVPVRNSLISVGTTIRTSRSKGLSQAYAALYGAITNHQGRTPYQCYICGQQVGTCPHTAGITIDCPDYEAIEKRISYIHEIGAYLDDKFLEYFVAKPHRYDNGDPRLKHERKRQGRGALFVIACLSSKMAREVIVPGIRHIAARHHKKVSVRGYMPKGRCMLRAFKVQVS